MPRKSASSTARGAERYTLTIEPGEVVRRGSSIGIAAAMQLTPDSARGIAVVGQRVAVDRARDGRSFRVDTSNLPVGLHTLPR